MITKYTVTDRAEITEYDLLRARQGMRAILDIHRGREYSQKTNGKWVRSARAMMLHDAWRKRQETIKK